ncbi:hypothetical protein [Mastigocoleus sp. MO_188.B34]|uniref:hypothetical protein n=1 Tax=Mastigocoleus sp. MO_188.B34 TaxID=3036635 RepID=UPI00262C8E88|nr:hypothetical protein [Mastigocoleus sp. MO_188.B34]MDJ0697433.1 hypothetical protein [Mastigocoleus sp. MO_188.B34]
MLEYPSISKLKPKFPDYLDFQTLRDIGISHLQALSGKIWTDYNLHDPGVTILEVLCYAVTDLGYRNNLDIKDLLALNPADSQQQENNFFTPDQILTCNPVTEMDLRKRLIDIPGVRNAWLEKFTEVDATEKTQETTKKISTYHPAIYVNYINSKLQYNPPNGYTEENAPRLHPRGLYTVYIDLDLEYRKNACGQIYRSWSETLDQVKAVLCRYRNLCEDVYDIVLLGEEEIGLCSDIELEAEADAEDVLVEIYVKIQEFLSPQLRFYTLQELLEKGKSIDEIFAGRPSVKETIKEKNPGQDDSEEDAIAELGYASHGFIDTAELEDLTPPTVIYTSDLYQEILKIPGVAAVRRLSIVNFINGLAQSQSPWHLQLTKGYSPILGIEHSKINLFKGVLPISPEVNEVKRRYYEQQAAHIKVLRQDSELDLSIPQGSYYDLADHYSIQHDFPLTYGIGEDGLPATATVIRKAQARQLKGYLVFFDQLLANYLAQLTHIRDLFSWEIDKSWEQRNDHMIRPEEKSHTYFIQELDFPDKLAILGEDGGYLDSIVEEPETYRDRRNRFLDHLLGRFAESFADYVVKNYRIIQERRDKVKDEIEVIHDKARFLQDYPFLSRDRFRAFNYCNCQQVWDTTNVSGFQKRVSRLLGFNDVRRRNLCHYQVDEESGQFISFSVSCGHQKQSLISLQTYSDQKAAQADREKFLLLALHENFYKRLTYSYFYHYGLEVEVKPDNENEETITARYESYFASQAERLAKLDFLSKNLARLFNFIRREDDDVITDAISTISQKTIIKMKDIGEENLYYFQLNIPVDASPTPEIIKFDGAQRYFSQELARKAAIAILQQITNRQNYYPILFRQDNSAERETATPSNETKFTHYGYALIDNKGQVLGESSHTPTESFHERFSTEQAREAALQSWLSCLKFNPNQFKDSDERFLQVEEVTGETSGYRFRLIDREEVTLLHGMQLFADENTTRDRFYEDVLGILFEPGAIEPTASQLGFGFRVLSQPRNRGSAVATSPQLYASESERDAAIEHLFLLVRTAHLNITWTGLENSSGPTYIGRIYDQNRNILLEASHRHNTPEAAWEQGNVLMELAGAEVEFPKNGKLDAKNFRLISVELTLLPFWYKWSRHIQNTHPVDVVKPTLWFLSLTYYLIVEKPYGWELTNRGKDQILATQYYTSKEERNKSIQTLQKLVNDEGFHLLEHILLRPRTTSDNFLPICVHTDDATSTPGEQTQLTYQYPYSFWITIILPYWPERFRNIDFRRFVERTLRLEAPAHVALKIAWINVKQMRDFELAYRDWLEQLAWETGNGSTCNLSGSLNHLLAIIPKLRSIYPQGILYDPQVVSREQPIILNQSALGTASE